MTFLQNLSKLLFSNDLKPIWKQFCEEQNGNLKSESGDIYASYTYENFHFKIKDYTYRVAGSSYEEKYIVGYVEFSNPIPLELSLTKEDVFTEIGKFFNNKELKVGNPLFDKKFFITSNKELKAITILRDKQLTEQIIALNPTRVEITNKEEFFGERPSNKHYMLYVVKQDKLKDISQLNEMHAVLVTFTENLRLNCQIH